MRKLLGFVVLIWVLVFPGSVTADWVNLGIFGGQVYSITIDPSNPDTMFAGTYLGGGLFVSRDGGTTWQTVDANGQLLGEDDFVDHAVHDVAIAPSDPNVIWVAHNHWLAKSVDGGQTWTHIRNDTIQSDCMGCGGSSDDARYCNSLAIDPQNPDVVYVGTTGPDVSSVGGAVYKTVDGGLNWQKLNDGNNLDYRVEDVVVDVARPDILWAVTNSNGVGGYDGTVYRSTNGGQNWTPIDPKPTAGGILSIAPKPDDPDTVFISCGYGVVQLDRTGDTWAATYPLWDQGCVMSSEVVFAPSDPNTLYAAWMAPSAYWGGDDLPKLSRGIFNAAAGTWSWETYVVDTRYATQLFCLAVSPTDREVVFGGDQGLGIMRSLNHGQAWTLVNQGLDAVLVYDVDVEEGNTSHMIAASGSGLFERMNVESVWERRHNSIFHSVRFHPGSGTAYYGGMDGYVARTVNNGTDWSYSNFFSSGRVTDIAVDPVATGTLYITTSLNGRQVQRSLDGGATFSPVLDGVNTSGEGYAMNTLSIDPADPQHILAGGGNFYFPYVLGDLWESFQGGEPGTWQRTGLTNAIVNTVLIDPRDSNRIYAGCGYSYNFYDPENPDHEILQKSVDGGASWQAATMGMPLVRAGLYSLWGPDQHNVFAVGSNGYAVYYDGARWHTQPTPTLNSLYGIHGRSARDVFAVGINGTILYHDGSQWESMDSPTSVNLYKVWATSSDQAYAVGADGVILHYNGTRWATMTSPTSEDLYEIKGTSATNIYACGTGGVILRYDGSSWKRLESGVTTVLDALWLSGSDDVYAVGNEGVIQHFDGSTWTSMQSGISDNLWGVWGSGPTNIYAVGPQGHFLHFDGSQWSLEDLNPDGNYQEIWGFSSGQVVFSDALGGVWGYDGRVLSPLREQGTANRSVTDLAFHRTNPDIVYAGTVKAGVYITPNQAGSWANLGVPPSSLYAITSGSLYAATGAGLYQLSGTGVLAGNVRNSTTMQSIHQATIASDIGLSCSSVDGLYMMVSPAGIFDLYATRDNYQMGIARNLTVTGTEVTWHDFNLVPGSSVAPGGTSGGLTDTSGDTGGGGYCFIGALPHFTGL